MSLKIAPMDSFREEAPKPPPRNDPGAVVMFFLGVGLLLIIFLLPGVNSAFRQMLSSPARPTLDPDALVWANRDSGVYYCSDSTLYGSGTGVYRKQSDALTEGYQPALGTYCSAKDRLALRKHKAPIPGLKNRKSESTSTSRDSFASVPPELHTRR